MSIKHYDLHVNNVAVNETTFTWNLSW